MPKPLKIVIGWFAAILVLWIVIGAIIMNTQPHTEKHYTSDEVLAALGVRPNLMYTVQLGATVQAGTTTNEAHANTVGLLFFSSSDATSSTTASNGPAVTIGFRDELGNFSRLTLRWNMLRISEGPADQRTIAFQLKPNPTLFNKPLDGTDTTYWEKKGHSVWCPWCGRIESTPDVRNVESYKTGARVSLAQVLEDPGVLDRVDVILPRTEFEAYVNGR